MKKALCLTALIVLVILTDINTASQTSRTDAQQQTSEKEILSGPVDITEELSVKMIRKGIWLVIHKFPLGANSLVVEMKDSTLLLVDTPWTPDATEQLLRWFTKKLGQHKIIVINTGSHWDNLGGNDYLVKHQIPVYGSDVTVKLVFGV